DYYCCSYRTGSTFVFF
nr:immunoglobulin light chain junction region [Macaca mulatta]MOW01739.1 immunoglobulin light chain junction region [Macaca mulatta]